MQSTKRILPYAAMALAVVVAACGGGGGGGEAAPAAASLTLSGTAATGAAIANKTVEVKCASGSGTGTTANNGSFSISISGGALPCVARVTTAAGVVLHTVITGTGSAASANITPLTHLIVASLTGVDPAVYFAAFEAGAVAALTGPAVTAAQDRVVAALKTNGIDASGLGNLITGNLVAASGSTAGSAVDQLLDTLKAKLDTAGVTLASYTTTISQTAATATPSAVVSVSADLALQPAAATCAALRSGVYRLIVPQVGLAGSNGSASTEKLVFNATVPSFTDEASVTRTLTPVVGSPCRFTTSAGNDIVFAQSGAFGIRTGDGFMGFGFPEQSIALADLAGNWNTIGYDRDNLTDPLGPEAFTFSVSSTGAVTFSKFCKDAKNCITSGLPTWTFTVNAAGGFDINRGNGMSRLFAFRTGGGEMMIAGTGQDGTWTVGTRVRTTQLPTVNAVSTGWNVGAVNQLTGSIYAPTGLAISEYTNTVVSVDATTGTWVRNNVTNFTGPVTRPEQVVINNVGGTARDGYNWRKPEAVVNSVGATVNVSEFFSLGLRGTGMTAAALPGGGPSSSTFNLSVAKP